MRGHPLGNTVMMAEGYERGLGLWPGVAVDQHFRERGRLPDLLAVARRFPNLLAVGIDEGTWVVVRGNEAQVRGAGGVTVLPPRDTGDPRPLVVPAGESFDFGQT